ncbi:hypothetical protein H7J07_05465 [Mycobacterium koreense]|uniref:Uncharacterized protein n=1 Tax=Mycolicibacillus koreensis TaxID=1069220 RepID=A0A7I7SAZ4_9MYCO|nr:hypothetical protein [Mycolicibacillus koreensis]MCV7247672.1 hypothetical protein [Mycolicibacillus koreensis]OSC34789.1 hypothetical protein B8W67_05950 [Mycolicibacillus koreensis]BBY54057.1 hypothetical protein MKOR_13080 [Mycolicibacillus koreensis]
MANVRQIDDEHGYGRRVTAWDCDRCGTEVAHYPGMGDVDCPDCGACYNASGQRLRDDWRDNPSNYDDDISDLDGYEMQHAGD